MKHFILTLILFTVTSNAAANPCINVLESDRLRVQITTLNTVLQICMKTGCTMRSYLKKKIDTKNMQMAKFMENAKPYKYHSSKKDCRAK